MPDTSIGSDTAADSESKSDRPHLANLVNPRVLPDDLYVSGFRCYEVADIPGNSHNDGYLFGHAMSLSYIFKVHHPSQNGLYAVKVLNVLNENQQSRNRFQRQLDCLKDLNQRKIARVPVLIDHDPAPSLLLSPLPWLRTKWISGETLSAIKKRLVAQNSANYPTRENILSVLSIFESICEIVRDVHALGWVHRDLKPDNIIVDAEGQVSLIDFGTVQHVKHSIEPGSKQVDLQGQTGAHDNVEGTEHYIAPERLSSKKQKYTLVQDVYSLGAILLELLTPRSFCHDVCQEYEDDLVSAATEILSHIDPDALLKMVVGLVEVWPRKRYPQSVDELVYLVRDVFDKV